MDRITELPAWVVPALDEVQECYRVAWRLAETGLADRRERGVLAVLIWLVIGDVAPLTHRSGQDVHRETARAESWVALCVAAGRAPPTPRDWDRLGVAPRPAVTDEREYAYGAWRALAWLLGVRRDWPLHTAWHRAAGLRPERPHLHLPRSQRRTAAWRAADRAARDQAEADALRHWRHVRRMADVTDGARPAPGSRDGA